MDKITITLAAKRDKNKLLKHFKHYRIKNLIKNRTECYTSHNFTVMAKDNDELVGVLQYCIKEDPRAGVAEFEEVHVSEGYRCRGIGSAIIKFAIQSAKEQFKKVNVKPRKIFLFVGKNNVKARTLYERCGFKCLASVGNLFSPDEEELFYSLDL